MVKKTGGSHKIDIKITFNVSSFIVDSKCSKGLKKQRKKKKKKKKSYQITANSSQANEVSVVLTLTNIGEDTISSLEINLLDTLNLKLLNGKNGLVPIPFSLPAGEFNTTTLRFNVQTITMPQTLKGTASYTLHVDFFFSFFFFFWWLLYESCRNFLFELNLLLIIWCLIQEAFGWLVSTMMNCFGISENQ